VTRHLDFYFDFISPFGWLASLRIDALAARHGYTTQWHSMLLGVSVLKVMGMKPLRQYPLKGDYLKHDLLRYMRRHGIRIGRDLDTPPANPVPAGRIFHIIQDSNPEEAKTVARHLLKAYWGDGRDIGHAELALDLASEVGADRQMLADALASGEGDRLLRAAVDRSLARGVFGSPFFIVDDEPFFGLEKMELLEDWLSTQGW
jgi:2-hydroxychromene-2-carboxylate isomerase